MKIEQPGHKQKMITIENRIRPFQRLAIILAPFAILVVSFWAFFIIETENLPTWSDHFSIVGKCIMKSLTEGNTECLPDLGYIILSAIIGGPFGFYCSYKIWQSLNTTIILTDQKIIKKQPSGKQIQFYWGEVKKITIFLTDQGGHLVFYRKKGSPIFDDKNRIFCQLSVSKEKHFLSPDAANLILTKIDRYNISVKGKRALLEEIAQTPHQSQLTSTRPFAQNATGTNHLPGRRSAPQKPTPK